ncbi:MAG: hypothetical protein KGZ58_04830 [Ignavibacteriales bacterium]|nr:hypothetical protein [Ignavibacteriales bacterium]
MKISFLLILTICFAGISVTQQHRKELWLTPAEKSNFHTTPRYDKTIYYLQRMAKVSPWIHLTYIGKTPEGRPMPLVIVSKNSMEINPKRAQASGKAIVLVQSGIHAGEIDGKDASLMLLRDICVTKEKEMLLEKIILLILPIYNLDGHERFSPFNRINQNGPDSMGWRTTAQNLNLNRDYMKADAPETQMWLKLFNEWLPDFYVDCHVTDGADYQYPITYAINDQQNVAPSVRSWITDKLLPSVDKKMAIKNILLAPYIFWKNERDVTQGIVNESGPPRFSTEYGVIQNRPAYLIETHMLKNYKTRVEATYHLLQSLFEEIYESAGALRLAVRTADEEIISAGEKGDGNFKVPLQMELTDVADTMMYLGYKYSVEESEVSKNSWMKFTNEPQNIRIPLFKTTKVQKEITLPYAYLIPQQWTSVLSVLKLHDIKLQRLTKPTRLQVESYKFSNAHWNERPFEGRHYVNFMSEKITEERMYPSGTIVVPMNQRAAKVAVHLLEPDAPDALIHWGFLDALFEQKEYGEDYVLEKLAREMMNKDANLKNEFEQKIATDSIFAKSSFERLNFFYKKSPYWDARKDVYPIAKIVRRMSIPVEPLKK